MGLRYLRSKSLLDFDLVLCGLKPPLHSLSALLELLQAAGELLQLGGPVQEALAQPVHPPVQLRLLVS